MRSTCVSPSVAARHKSACVGMMPTEQLKFGVAADTLTVSDGVVSARDGRAVGYGELAGNASLKREATAKVAPKPPAIALFSHKFESENFGEEFFRLVWPSDFESGRGESADPVLVDNARMLGASERQAEDKAAVAIEKFIAKKTDDTGDEGVHYSDLFEHYLYAAKDNREVELKAYRQAFSERRARFRSGSRAHVTYT